MTARSSAGSRYAASPAGGAGGDGGAAFFTPTGQARFGVSACTDIGGRPYQEDRMLAYPECTLGGAPHAFFAVMDGHGGAACAEFIRSRLFTLVTENFRKGDCEGALAGGFRDVEAMWTRTITTGPGREKGWSSGSCVLAAILAPDRRVHVSWVGDCRMVAWSPEQGCLAVTADHKPNRASEQARIERCGGEVRCARAPGGWCVSCCGSVGAGPPRVYPGGLAVARSIGTIKCKKSQYGAMPGCVISVPEYNAYRPHIGTRYLIMASDGLWDYFPKTKGLGNVIAAFEKNATEDGREDGELARYILKAIRRRNLGRPPDNVTILVVALAEHH
jgi:protein phosphatase 2C family protein 2/3